MSWLAIDTSAPRAVVARVTKDVTVIDAHFLLETRRHAEELPGAIARLLVDDDIEGVVVGIGPGSFVGVRVGLSTAKGFAHARGLPIVGVNSLATLVEEPTAGLSHAVVDARRGEIYVQDLEGGLPVGIPRAVRPSAAKELEGTIVTSCPELIEVDAMSVPGPSALGLARMLGVSDEADIGALVPIYGRAPDAKLPKTG